MFTRILFAVLLSFTLLKADVIEVRSFKEIAQQVSSLTAEDLVVCDVNLVLIRCKNPAFHLRNEEKHKLTLFPFKWKMSSREKDIFYTAIFALDGSEILEEEAVRFFKDLHKKGVKTLAITTAYTGTLLDQDMREAHFKWLDPFSFEKGFGKERITLDNLQTTSFETPFYESGILFRTSNNLPSSKGDVLKAFLERVDFTPDKRVIIIDDVKNNLEQMAAAIHMLNPEAQIIKLHYTGEYHMDTQDISSSQMKAAWDKAYDIARAKIRE